MEIAPENDAAKAKRQSILSIMRDTALTGQEKQQRIQALHTAPGHAVAAMAKKPSPEPSPEPPEPSSSPSPPPEDATPPAADQVAPESAPEVDLASPPTSRGSRRRARANREAESTASSAMSVTPSPKPSTSAATTMAARKTAVAEDEPPEVAAARKRRDEVMKSATSSSRTTAGTVGGGVRTGARSSRRRSVARIGRSSFADSASAGDDNDENGEGTEEEGQRRNNSGDITPLMSAASRPTRRRRRLADVRADTANTRMESEEGDVEDDRKPAAIHTVAASAPSPIEAEDRQLTRPGVVAVSAIDERIARKQSSNLGGPRNTAATATSKTAAGVAAASVVPAAPVAPMPSVSSSGAARVGAFSCTDLDDKIARKTAGEGRRAGAASAFSVSTSTNTINQLGSVDNSINTGARSQSMMPSRTGHSLGGDGDFIPGSRSASMYTSRRQRRRRSGGGIEAGVGALATVAAVPKETTIDGPEIGNIATHDEHQENEEAFTSKQQQSPHDTKPHHICCKECGRPYTPPESFEEDDVIDETPRTTSGPESRRTLLTSDSTAVSSGDDMAVGAVYEDVLNDVGENNPEQSGEWGSRHSGVLSTTESGDWGSRGAADTYDFEDDASDALDGTMPIKASEYEEESLNDEVKCNDEGNFRQSTISWGTAAAALNLDDMELDNQGGEIDGDVPPPANVDCSVDDITIRRGSLEHGVQGLSEESLAVEDLEKAAADDRALKKDLHLIKEEGTYDEDDDYYYDYDEEHGQYHTDLQDSYNPAHQTDPFNHHSDHFFADDFMEKGPATRTRARRESFKDTRLEGFVLSRDDKCNLFIGLLLIIVVTIGVSVPVTLIKKEANEAQNAPTMSPTFVRDSVYAAMLNEIVLKTGTSAEVFEDDDAPQTKALRWIAYDDLAGLIADSPNLIQRYSLMCLFFGSGGSSTLLGWENEDAENECSWFGVKCRSDIDMVGNNTSSSANGNVTSLDLKRTRLAGSLVSEIGSLKHLESLNLGENFLKGAIPSTLYDLSKLQRLVLEKNFFGPYLTEGLGDLSQLETLSLNDNRFESELPTTIVDLKALKDLYLFSNSFSGPLVEYILDMPALEVVDVANNMFTGTIVPSIGRLSNLRYLLLGRNSLSGTIPGEIGLLSSLEFLGLEANALQGSIPTEIGQLRKLTRLGLARSGLSSSLPRELGNLVNLQLLDASKQSLTGEIPSTLGNMRELIELNLMGNDLSGTIPSELGKCTSLLEIQLQRNDLTGTVGEEICSLRENHFLDDLRVDCVSKIACDVFCCTRCT